MRATRKPLEFVNSLATAAPKAPAAPVTTAHVLIGRRISPLPLACKSAIPRPGLPPAVRPERNWIEPIRRGGESRSCFVLLLVPYRSESSNLSPRLLKPGDIVAGKFRVDGLIGEGGMGIVVAATHLFLREQVALKFLRPELLALLRR